MLKIGDKVPAFELISNTGKVSAASLKGQRYLLYFYPKDDTPGCTTQACGLRDDLPKFDTAKLKVFGVSADSLKAHEKFVEKYQLNFPLLADPERQLIEAMGVWVEKSMYGKKYMGIARASFVIGPTGVIEQVWEKVSPATHAADVLAFVTGKASATASKSAAKPSVAKKTAAKPSPPTKPVQKAALKKPAAKKVAATKTQVK